MEQCMYPNDPCYNCPDKKKCPIWQERENGNEKNSKGKR